MKKVMCFGTFDLLHEGHKYLLRRAARFGELHVVIGRDQTVTRVKQRAPIWNEKQRQAAVQDLRYVHTAHLGSKGKDKLALVKKIKPDVIVLGYDQSFFIQTLLEWTARTGTRVITLPAFHPEKYKTSILRQL